MRTRLSFAALLIASSAFAGERCVAARETFANVASGYACQYEIWRAGWVNCEDDAAGMKKMWDLTDRCTTAAIRVGTASERIGRLEDRQLEVLGLLDPLREKQLSKWHLVDGIVPLFAGEGLVFGSLIYALYPQTSAFTGIRAPPGLTPLLTGILIGGIVGVVIGVALLVYVLSSISTNALAISQLEERLSTLNSEIDRERTDDDRLQKMRGAPGRPSMPALFSFNVAQF